MNFLPDNYEAPKTIGNYMKFADGENKFRILSRPIIGWEDWDGNRPVRFRMENKPLKPIDPAKMIRHFWSMIVWNYNEEKIQILHVVQASIRNTLESLCKDKDWGLPFFYDIKVVKKGKGKDTEYMATPLPHKPLPASVKYAFEQKPCWLEALFDNADPFQQHPQLTPGVFTQEQADAPKPNKVEKINSITDVQAMELIEMLAECDPVYRTSIQSMLKKQKIVSMYDLPLEMYNKLRDQAERNKALYAAQLSERQKESDKLHKLAMEQANENQ